MAQEVKYLLCTHEKMCSDLSYQHKKPDTHAFVTLVLVQGLVSNGGSWEPWLAEAGSSKQTRIGVCFKLRWRVT